jgi:hypothetical protein
MCFLTQGPAGRPHFVSGATDDLPLIPVPGEVFELRKLLPSAPEVTRVSDFLKPKP